MAQISRRHHTVPRFYLDGFSLNGQTGTVELPGRRRFSQSVRKASTVTDFYLLGDPSTLGADAFEEALSTVETDAAEALRAVIAGQWPLSAEQREPFALFILLQFLRGPNQRQQMREMGAQLARMDISLRGKARFSADVAKKLGREVEPEQLDRLWEQATRAEGPPIPFTAVDHMMQVVDFVPKMLPYVIGRPWALIRFQQKAIVTCDTPVVLVPGKDSPDGSGVGLMTAGAIVFPLARRLGLVLADPFPLAESGLTIDRVAAGDADLELPPSAQQARLFNHAMFASARRHVFHHPDDGEIVPTDLPEPAESEMEPIEGDFIEMGESLRAQHTSAR